jgi:hypothetical protein
MSRKTCNLVSDTQQFSFSIKAIESLLTAKGCKRPENATVNGLTFFKGGRPNSLDVCKMDITLSWEDDE